MDYKSLLKKYMLYVYEQENTDFTGKTLNFDNSLTDAEKNELRDISKSNSYLVEQNKKVKYAPRKR